MVAQRADWVRRMQKYFDQMNVCVHQAVSDITGVTGMAIIRAIVAGERDPSALARLRDRRCRKSKAQIAEQLNRPSRDVRSVNFPALGCYNKYFFGLFSEHLLGHLVSLYFFKIPKKIKAIIKVWRQIYTDAGIRYFIKIPLTSI
jgi:hypothetical protein